MISVIPYGESALLVNFEQRISQTVQRQVGQLWDAMRDHAGVLYLIPAYCSLTVVFDVSATTFEQLQEDILNTYEGLKERETTPIARLRQIPVCYDGNYAIDLDEVAQQTGKSPEEIIRVHQSTEFYVYMLGFMPGFAYMGDMPDAFFCHRKPEPRTRVPAGSVGLAGLQTAIYPLQSPGGWQIIGRTPVKLFDPALDPPNFLRAGDRVRFTRISKEQYEAVEHEHAA